MIFIASSISVGRDQRLENWFEAMSEVQRSSDVMKKCCQKEEKEKRHMRFIMRRMRVRPSSEEKWHSSGERRGLLC